MRRTNSGFFECMKQQIIVIKIGTSGFLDGELKTVRLSMMAQLSEVVRKLRDQGHYVVLVSSGAIGVGCQQMGIVERPTEVSHLQALAAIGQVHLMRYYDELFNAVDLKCSQVLVDGDVFARRHQYLNARNTFRALLEFGAVPIANENDSVAVEELKIGDNDALSAKVAIMCEADWLFLLTDVDCLYDRNPREYPDAKEIHIVEDVHKLAVETTTSGTQWGTGGMGTKLTAARLATSAGTTTVICSSTNPSNILKVMDGQQVGTVFLSGGMIKGKKRWILSVPVKGSIIMDDGAVRAVKGTRRSLFAAGILGTIGDFSALDCVSLCDRNGEEFGRGLTNYSGKAIEKVKGQTSECFEDQLEGYMADEMIYRANICLLDTHYE